MAGENDLIFREEQKFGGWLRWLLVLDSAFFIALMLFLISCFGNECVQKLPVFAAIVIIIVPMALAVLFWIARLEMEVRSDGLYVRFFPLHIHFKKFAFEDFSQYYAREYSPILEYGGWGIRYTFRNGKAFNVSGNKGVQIVFKNGKKLLIGSQKPQELVAAIDSIMKGNAKENIV